MAVFKTQVFFLALWAQINPGFGPPKYITRVHVPSDEDPYAFLFIFIGILLLGFLLWFFFLRSKREPTVRERIGKPKRNRAKKIRKK